MPKRRFLYSTVVFCLVLLISTAVVAKRSKTEKAEIESRVMWSYEFPGALHFMEISRNGLIHAVSREGKGKKAPRKRFLLNDTGQVYWQGDANRTVLIADAPLAVIMGLEGEQIVLRAIHPSGSERWQHSLHGMPVSMLSDASSGILILAVMPYSWILAPDNPHNMELVALNINTGQTKWTASLDAITAPQKSLGGELAIGGGSVWWAGGGRAARINLSSGKIAWNVALEASKGQGSLWHIASNAAWLIKGGTVFSFSGASGLTWHRSLRQGASPHGLALTAAGLVAACQDEKGVTLALLDPASGADRWIQTLKHKKGKSDGPPPAGVAVSGTRVALAVDGYFVGHDLSSGAEVYRQKVKSKIFRDTKQFQALGDHVVLVGMNSAIAFAIDDGRLLWKHEGFESPYEIKKKSVQMMAQVAGIAMATGSSQASQLRQKAGQYAIGSSNYQSLMGEAARLDAQASKKQIKKLSGAIQKLQKGVEIALYMVNNRYSQNYASFYRNLSSKFAISFNPASEINAVLVDLDTGELSETGVRKSRTGCSTTLLVDPSRRLIIQAYQQLGMACKDEHRVDVLSLTP